MVIILRYSSILAAVNSMFLFVCVANNLIAVGATALKADKEFCGQFTNYGQHSVDLFAPGVKLLSLFPGNQYEIMDGTSFSCPVVSGVAALVWSHYPELSAVELKDILLNSCSTYPKLKVYYPSMELMVDFTGELSTKKKKTKFQTLSITGGVVNAYSALRLADNYCKNK